MVGFGHQWVKMLDSRVFFFNVWMLVFSLVIVRHFGCIIFFRVMPRCIFEYC